MAVQGAAAKMMQPAMYWSASAGLIHAENAYRKKSQARMAIENGFTSQFTKSVMSNPDGLRPTSLSEDRSTFIIIGMIMSQIRMAMGKLIWLPSPNSQLRNRETRVGNHWPRRRPPTMHRPTHMVR